MHIFDLPYDVRYRIYQHLFPADESIYIQAFNDGLKIISASQGFPLPLLSTCKSLYGETSGYMYNSYLFNIVGRKQNCLKKYAAFVQTVKKHAREDVHVEAFSNGAHSATMCLSVHVGNAKTALLERRGRGEHKDIVELEREVASAQRKRRLRLTRLNSLHVLAGGIAVFAFVVAWLLSYRTRTIALGASHS